MAPSRFSRAQSKGNDWVLRFPVTRNGFFSRRCFPTRQCSGFRFSEPLFGMDFPELYGYDVL